LSSNGIVTSANVVVGAVESEARRWRRLEADLIGHAIEPRHAAEKAEEYSGDFQGRDGIEAPGWYRVKVLPSLVRRAVQGIQEKS
jgi:aerobic carbon-monoxide dehydrogenase medium subunit